MTRTARIPLRTESFAASLLVLLVAGGDVAGGVGVAVSDPIAVDTVAPVVTVDPVPENLLLQAGQEFTFHWRVADDHPGTAPLWHVAWVLVHNYLVDSYAYWPPVGDHTWVWTVPEISAGSTRLAVWAADAFGNYTFVQGNPFTVLPSASDAPSPGPGYVTALPPSEPNPFNAATNVVFELGRSGRVALTVHSVDGRRVRRLVDGVRPAGRQSVRWDGRDDAGRAAASGTYLLRMETEGWRGSRRLALIK